MKCAIIPGFISFLLLLVPGVMADSLVVNSQEWTDVYTGMIYAAIEGHEGTYIIDEGHAAIIQPTFDERTIIIESVNNPHVRNYNLNVETELIQAGEDFNLELAGQVEPEGYILIDDGYTYNAVSVAPYAARSRYYVIFADSDNVDEVQDIVGDAPVIIYGYVDREVTDAFSGATIINKGDKFSNNLEIMKMFIEDYGTNQLLISNGEFLEPQFFFGYNPVLFIGKSNIPEQTIDYLKDSEVKHGILIGYELFDNAVTLKNQLDMKIMVKFAKGIDSRQYALDILELPKPNYQIGISSVTYNTHYGQLEVSYFNSGDFPAFIKGSHNILSRNSSIAVVGDESAVFIGVDEVLTQTYEVSLGDADDLTVRSNVLYGEDRGALEFLSIIETDAEVISYEDDSDIEIEDVEYDKATKRFLFTIRNAGSVDVYAKPLLIDVIVNNKLETLTADTEKIETGQSMTFAIKARLTPEDLLDNEKITAGVRFGKRIASLVHYKEEVLDFKIRSMAGGLAVAGAGIAVVALLVLLVLRRRKQKRRLRPAPRAR